MCAWYVLPVLIATRNRTLRESQSASSFAVMQSVARLLQFVGLAIPPLAMIAQLGNHITAGKMLQFLLVSVGIFLLGYTIQRYSGPAAK